MKPITFLFLFSCVFASMIILVESISPGSQNSNAVRRSNAASKRSKRREETRRKIQDGINAARFKERKLQAFDDDEEPSLFYDLDSSAGPVYPEHIEPDGFVPIHTNVSVEIKYDIPLTVEEGCRQEEIEGCPDQLSQCLGVDAESVDAACQCFWENGQCYRLAGCFELLPKHEREYCFNTLLCSMDACEGSGVQSVVLSSLIAVFAVISTFFLVSVN